MKTIVNRTVLTVTPKQPYIDWANSLEDDGPKIEPGNVYSTALLIPDRYDEHNFEGFLKRHYAVIFEQELESWSLDTTAWPKNRNYKRFKAWFEVRASDMAIDFGGGPIKTEEF